MMSEVQDRPQSLIMKIGMAVVLGGAGALTGYGMARYFESDGAPWPDVLATAMAVALIAVGLMSAVVMATRPSTMPKGCGILQIVVFLLAGAMFLLPMYAPASLAPDMVFGGIAVLLAIQTVANVMLWRRADEMLRQVMAETSAIAFWALQTALFLYAAAERLGLVDTISGWALVGILMAVYLLSSIVASARRGIT
ncbi:hypothetical protein IP78_02600 [Brevundimonas sp. AAP58]|uniref:hypothetical protein n=1 Tax=Brevundimonas sp. AAP58 TaxID=1523422 RepID=UPI0006B981BB|nr:hypothetical protein [Brevundimonas sp. AAP58]KPF83213.1 hypothetical protein IP78_02600 [Brevundimonas sp. AAP58]